ncbi:MAG: aminotransferase class V-fold PLP-dependent enzyme, partial [Clostridiales bacterium]
PDRLESGTPNMPGIYGLHQSLAFVLAKGVSALRHHEMELTAQFLAGLAGIPGVRLCGTTDLAHRVGVISLDFQELDNAEVTFRLEAEFGILTRCGLHCAPSAHQTIGTFPQGTVRFSLGFQNTSEEIAYTLEAIRQISGK